MPLCSRKMLLFCLGWLYLTRVILCWEMPLLEPSEARYSVIARNMAESGNFLEPQFVYEGVLQNYEGKPALVFQIGGLACRYLGESRLAVRLPALLSGLAILGMVFYAVCRLRDEKTATLAVLLCSLSGAFYIYSGLMMIDLALAAASTGGILCYALFCAEESGWRKKMYSVGYFVAMGVGMIVKGPIVLVMAGLPVFLYVGWNGRWGELRKHAWVVGSFFFLAIALPWYVMMSWENPKFLEYFFLHENLGRFFCHNYGDRFGSGRETFRGMALVWFCVVNLPLLFFVPWIPSCRKPFFSGKLLRDPLTGLSLLTVLAITGFWCLTSRSLLYYLLPTIPFLAIFIAVRHYDSGLMERPGVVRGFRWTLGLLAILLPLGIWSSVEIGEEVTSKLSKDIYKELSVWMESEPEYQKLGVYFAETTPYSADFHFGNRVRIHSEEKVSESLERSRDAILFLQKETPCEEIVLENRRLLMEDSNWQVYSPEEPTRVAGGISLY